ncbi:hypothetical protein DFJ43DRAFT_1008889, partial [Lentinula guzmanii]
ALHWIHSAGWVHRDISDGNLYYHKERNIGLIGDLEYAKKVEIQSHRNVRAVGYPHFMASEAISDAYLFYPYPITPKPPRARSNCTNDHLPGRVHWGGRACTSPFNHNALHDIESVWWVLVYTILFNEDPAGPSQNTSTRQHLMNTLFDGQLNNTSRLYFLRNAQFNGCLPSSFSSLEPALQEYAKHLTAAFSAAEKDYPIIQPLATPQIHEDCISAFYTEPIFEAITNAEMTYVKIRAQDVPGSGQKRSGKHLDEPEGSQRKKSRRMLSVPMTD